MSTEVGDTAASQARPDVVTLAEETARIGIQRVAGDLVRVRSVTETLDHVERADLGVETIEVERRPVGAWVDSMPGVREEGELTIFPVVEERLVIEKRLFVTEEIVLRRNRSVEAVEVPVTLRRQNAVIERIGASDLAEAGGDPPDPQAK